MSSSPTTKPAEKKYKDNNWVETRMGYKKIWNRMNELSTLTNEAVFVFGCVCRNIANFGNFWSHFCLIHYSYWFYNHFFAWYPWNPDMLSLWNTKIWWKIKQYLNDYILYRNISNFWRFLGKYLPCSFHPLALWLHFCLKSWWAHILL